VSRLWLSGALVASTLLLGAGPALAAGPYPPPSKGTGHVDPSKIKAGECAVFSGDGFFPFKSVAVSDNGEARGSATTDVNGEFSKQLCYASNAKRGRHNLAGSGTGSFGDPLTVYAVLIVQGVSQSASNPSTHQGGAAASTGTTGGSSATVVSGGTSGAVQAPPAVEVPAGSASPVASANSGTRLIMFGVTCLLLAFLMSMLLLLIARRRRRSENDAPYGAMPMPA
jgi:hypothetical protein